MNRLYKASLIIMTALMMSCGRQSIPDGYVGSSMLSGSSESSADVQQQEYEKIYIYKDKTYIRAFYERKTDGSFDVTVREKSRLNSWDELSGLLSNDVIMNEEDVGLLTVTQFKSRTHRLSRWFDYAPPGHITVCI